MVATQQIPRAHWPEYLGDVSKHCRGWRTTVEVMSLGVGDQPVIDGLPLLGMSVESAGSRRGDILIESETRSGQPAFHYVVRPIALQIAMTEPGSEADIQIEMDDGTITLVRLHSHPELPPPRVPDRLSGLRGEERSDGPRLAPDEASGRRRTLRPPPPPSQAAEPAAHRQLGPTLRRGWPFLLRGLAAVAFGVLAIALPGLVLLTLVVLFGVFAITDGALNLIAGFRRGGRAVGQPRWLLFVKAFVGLAAGAVALTMPGITALALLFVIAGWAIVMGVLEITASVQLGERVKGAWALAAAGSLSVVFGVLLFLFPGAGALALAIWIGAYAIVFGALLIARGFQARRAVPGGEDRRAGETWTFARPSAAPTSPTAGGHNRW